MKKLTITLLASASLVLSGCASYSQMDRVLTNTQFQDAKVEESTINKPAFVLPKPADGQWSLQCIASWIEQVNAKQVR
jgi:uncharacterized lipoprotein NlpE involved in copper resistance